MFLAKKKRGKAALFIAAVLLCMLWLPLAARAEEETAPSSGDLHVEVTEETMEDVPVALSGGGNAPEETPEPSSPGGAGDAETPAPPPAAVMPTYVVAPAGDAEATYQIEGGSWVNGTLTEAFRAVSDGGTIKLLRDVTVNNNDNTALLLRDKAATLLGDGHSVCLERGSILVDGTGKLNLGREGESGTLIISSKDDPNCIINLRGSGTLHMYEGVTLGPSRAGGQPAGVFLEQNSSFTMHGGTITDCENWAAVTGGVMVTGDARFTMEGGEIRNCKGYLGGAVGLNPGTAIGPDTSGNASFVMTGGKITNCTDVSNGGGAVFAYTARAVTVDIRGGEITGCSTTAGNGGGLFLYVNNRNATVNLSGVTISGCTARHGGALALLSTCKATIGDGTVLRDNTASGWGGAGYLVTNEPVTFGAATITGNNAEYGGGFSLYSNSLSNNAAFYMSRAAVYNNHASAAGDDMVMGGRNTGEQLAELPADFTGLTLTAEPNHCGHAIDGFYDDSPDDRWTCPGPGAEFSKTPLPATVMTPARQTVLYLKAAHGKLAMEPVVVTPADLIVYSGGAGYTGLVTSTGDIIAKENGIPEPGYYITLPQSLHKQLGTENAEQDLSGKLTFLYDDGAGTTRQWDLALYGTAAHSTGRNAGGTRYVYRMLPGGPQQAPVRVKITDPATGDSVLNDDFVPAASQEFKEYNMMIYPGALDAGYVTARLTVGDASYTCPVQLAPGKLVVRSCKDKATFALAPAEAALVPGKVSALAGNGGTYFINGGNVQLADTAGAHLLVDTVLQQDALKDYLRTHYSGALPEDRWGYEANYLDLVDSANGNVYLTTAAGQEPTIYWPVPGDYKEQGQVNLYHFQNLNRSSTETTETLLAHTAPRVITPELVTVNDTRYFKFSSDQLSTFVLMYEKAEPVPVVTPSPSPVPGGTPKPTSGGGNTTAGTKQAQSGKPAASSASPAPQKPAPAARQKSSIPQTGDGENLLVWLVLMVLSLVAAVTIGIRYRKRRKSLKLPKHK